MSDPESWWPVRRIPPKPRRGFWTLHVRILTFLGPLLEDLGLQHKEVYILDPMPSLQHGRPDSESSSSSPTPRRRHHGHGASKSFADGENSPLLASPSPPVERQSSDSLEGGFEAADFRIRGDAHPLAYRSPTYHSSDESYFFDFIMEKVKSTKLAHFVD